MPGVEGARGARYRHRHRADARRKAGLDTLKLFPAEPLGGLRALRALAAPFPGVRFVPTGGIDASRLTAYLADPAVLAVGGSWMASAAHLERGDYQEIRRLTADAVDRSTT